MGAVATGGGAVAAGGGGAVAEGGACAPAGVATMAMATTIPNIRRNCM